MAVFSRMSFFSHSSLVVSGGISLYRVFLRCLNLEKFSTRLSRQTKLVTFGPSACFLPKEVRFRAKSKIFQGLAFTLNRDKSLPWA